MYYHDYYRGSQLQTVSSECLYRSFSVRETRIENLKIETFPTGNEKLRHSWDNETANYSIIKKSHRIFQVPMNKKPLRILFIITMRKSAPSIS